MTKRDPLECSCGEEYGSRDEVRACEDAGHRDGLYVICPDCGAIDTRTTVLPQPPCGCKQPERMFPLHCPACRSAGTVDQRTGRCTVCRWDVRQEPERCDMLEARAARYEREYEDEERR